MNLGEAESARGAFTIFLVMLSWSSWGNTFRDAVGQPCLVESVAWRDGQRGGIDFSGRDGGRLEMGL